jgi:hypothetical protein
MVEELACTSEIESHVGDSPAAGRATHAGQIFRKVPEKKKTLALQVGV